ncbi:hypothetical protein [Spirosoma flavum]|uniref:UDP-N-acetylglucosamine kinase n=1 Tax=Spirosoma flavum TaxID=2048557 RepID=A0ABW6API9_9BACT
MPNLYIMAGPNSAGKTTTAYTLLPEILSVWDFVNADEPGRRRGRLAQVNNSS